jgi:hypothetical protein
MPPVLAWRSTRANLDEIGVELREDTVSAIKAANIDSLFKALGKLVKYKDKSSPFVSPSPFKLRLLVELLPIMLDEGACIDTAAGSLYTWEIAAALRTASPPKSSSLAIRRLLPPRTSKAERYACVVQDQRV